MVLKGWRALGASFLAGALAALAMPPLFWFPLAVLGVVVFVWQWDTAPNLRGALLRGWAWGLGHFAVGSYWIVEAFYVPPAEYGPLGVPIVAGLAVVLGFFPGIAAMAAHWLARRWPHMGGRYRRLLLLAVCWTITEWLRGHVFTGYPWNPLGHVWAFYVPLLQSASLFGVYGLGLFTFVVLASPIAGWRAFAAALVVTGAALAAGEFVMRGQPVAADAPLVRIVQPNIAQAIKAQPGSRPGQLGKLISLSQRPGFDRVTVVVWPETAVPYLVEPHSDLLGVLAAAVPPHGYLFTGAQRGTENEADGVWNSLVAIDGDGHIVAHYDKVHLVPMGEYIPFHKELPPVSGLVGRGSFEVGDGPKTVSLPGVPPFSPFICYEAIFPGAITQPGHRPSWLLNVTNDAWFGLSTGPYQHLTSARLRAVEEGLPLIRSANTGVSAVVDAYGRILASLDMEQEGIIDHPLPPPRSATPYSRWGDWTLLGVVLLFAGIVVVNQPQSRRSMA
ncbi:MAG TPA: apolipoprotein N-acyltransferase [Reyranella sp.]|nr:apolipoprotein N-acyltransferase [Reyranella sp.]